MVVVIAAVPRARAILTAAGVLRAVTVVMTDRRVLADAFVAIAILAAVPIIAALGADAALGIPVLAADEPVAAVELLVAVTTGAGDLESAELAEVLAALIFWHALVSTTAGVSKQAQERMAGAIVTANFAVVAVGVTAALIYRDAITIATLPALGARIGADALVAE